jgi:hypothetical protein
MNDEDDQPPPVEMVTGRCQTSNLTQKSAALQAMRVYELRKTARDLNISLTSLKRWEREANNIAALAQQQEIYPLFRRNLQGGGRPSTISNQLGGALVEWIEQERQETKKSRFLWLLLVFIC